MQIIPAIDIIEGKCVRLVKGDYTKKKIYNNDPVEVARMFEDKGISRLHIVDLEGAKAKKIINLKVIEKVANSTQLIIDMGGGIQSDQDIVDAFNAGVSMITAGSIAVKEASRVEKWLDVYGSEKIILGADTLNEKIAISGWQEKIDLTIEDFLTVWEKKGVKQIISTDINKDGMMEGPALDYYSKLCADFPTLEIIASGGVSSIKDIENLQKIPVKGVIVGKAIYEGKVTVDELVRMIC